MMDTTDTIESASALFASGGEDQGNVVSRKPIGAGAEGIADFDQELSAKARRFHGAFEPIAANVYSAAEAHDEFVKLGFGPGVTDDEPQTTMTMPGPPAYCSRAGCMGEVPGEVVVAALGVFNPDLIIPNVVRGWATASRDEILAARERGAGRQRRGPVPLRRAAVSGIPVDAVGRALAVSRSGEEYRGDSHIAAWTSAVSIRSRPAS